MIASSFSAIVIIPAYNAERHLRQVIERIDAKTWEVIKEAIIINDGSRDGTQSLIEELKRENPGISSLINPKNLGYGRTVKKGLLSALNKAPDYVVCLHADGQYPPESLLEMLGTASKKKQDVLQGSRIKGKKALSGGMPLYKYVAGKLLTFLENLVFQMSLTDYHSGFLCYSRKTLEVVPFQRFSGSFDFDLEMIAAARKNGLSIGEIGIPTRYADEISYLNPIGYGFRVLKVLVNYIFFPKRYLKNGP